MHSGICNDDERPSEYSETNNVFPECQIVEAEGTQDTGAWNLNIETVPMVY